MNRIAIAKGAATGGEFTRSGQRLHALAPVVVLAAGGIGSPRVLHISGLMVMPPS